MADFWEAVATARDAECVTPIVTLQDLRVIASTEIDAAHPRQALFNGVFGAGGTGYCPVASYPTLYWMGFNFGVATIVDAVTWWYEYNNSCIPVAFDIQGSNDANLLSWDTVTSFINDGDEPWVPLTKYKFHISPVTYKAFRVNVTALRKAGVSTYSYIGEMELCCSAAAAGLNKNINMPVVII